MTISFKTYNPPISFHGDVKIILANLHLHRDIGEQA